MKKFVNLDGQNIPVRRLWSQSVPSDSALIRLIEEVLPLTVEDTEYSSYYEWNGSLFKITDKVDHVVITEYKIVE